MNGPTPGRGNSTLTLARIFLAFGLVILVTLVTIGVVLQVRTVQKSSWPTTQGEVIDVVKRVDQDSHRSDRERRRGRDRTSVTYAPVVRYTVNGTEHEFTSKVSTGDEWTVGQQVTVRYDPEDPASGEVDGLGNWVPWLLIGLGVGIGGTFTAVGIGLRRSARNRA